MVLRKASTTQISWGLNTRIRRAIIIILLQGLVTYQILRSWTTDPSAKIIYEIGDQVYLANVSRLPRIQFDFSSIEETNEEKAIRIKRQESVRNGFIHAWNGYTKYAWGHDELKPVSNESDNSFNGWGATIVDSLDTMWIMDLKDEFNRSRKFVSEVDFSVSSYSVNVFETTIRYLGGLLSAFELSKDQIFLEKAHELGVSLLGSFNSPFGLPYNDITLLEEGSFPETSSSALLARIGSLYLEFTKLAQLTDDSDFFFLVNNITNFIENANITIPGLYPIGISYETGEFFSDYISFGANGDSFYEYLIKEYILVGGALDQYRRMYIQSVESMHQYMIKEFSIKERPNMLFLGELYNNSFVGKMDHLVCFIPGMLAIGSKILDRPGDLETAKRLAETCYWLYEDTETGIGAEVNMLNLIESSETTDENEIFSDKILRTDKRYLLRPETIESLFVLYRVTGDKEYQEKGWKIWQAIDKWCKTPTAYSGLYDVTSTERPHNDNMESFFLAETLKYLYLLFSSPTHISLDTYVFNTEAHPLLRMAKSY
ncbi:7808_t:CDS:10 [Acaulospora morrowiae]|uniref:alpha-1,2-Mannosidase n=1 Tax=Acaulospora morrowiae TaxID=94023 RepID=A0A9N9D6E5_9GLOM|nr:7808_t:CDS:10 [Acaulospora morrowiae]